MPSRLTEPGGLYLRPTSSQRDILSVPLGDLIEGNPEEAVATLRTGYLKGSKRISFSVGDIVTETLVKSEIPFQVAVIDLKTQRRTSDFDIGHYGRKFFLRNPAGNINLEAWSVLRTAASVGPNSLVLVEGEEDLLTAVAMDVAEEGTLVIYGQPARGMVVVDIEAGVKKRIRDLIESFPLVPSSSEQKP